MTTTDRAAILEKIKRLLALAKSANEHEAAAALAAALRLSEQHRVSEAEINAETDEALHLDEIPIYESARDVTWKSALAATLSNAHGVKAVSSSRRKLDGWPSNAWRVRLIGRPSDIAIVRYLFAWCSAELERLATRGAREATRRFEDARREALRDTSDPFRVARIKATMPPSARRWKSSFLLGAVDGIREQLEKAKAEVRTTASTTALVRLDGHIERLNAFAQQQGVAPGRPRRVLVNETAQQAGLAAGRSMHLGAALPTAAKALPSRGES